MFDRSWCQRMIAAAGRYGLLVLSAACLVLPGWAPAPPCSFEVDPGALEMLAEGQERRADVERWREGSSGDRQAAICEVPEQLTTPDWHDVITRVVLDHLSAWLGQE